jgi:hypothetical protein
MFKGSNELARVWAQKSNQGRQNGSFAEAAAIGENELG